MGEAEFRSIIEQITYKPGWAFILGDDGERYFVQASVSVESDLTMDPTRRSAERTPWKSGKRYLSSFMCRQEVVGLVFSLIKDAEEHELREWFRYRGASIFNPHLDPDVLVDVARRKASFCIRVNAMSMAEPVAFSVSFDAAPPSPTPTDADAAETKAGERGTIRMAAPLPRTPHKR